MQIIPVIDIMRGIAVHARRGERSAYRPIQSILLQGADPVALLRAYRATFKSDAVYIADLDAITRGGDNLDVIAKMAAAESRCDLLVDAGIRNVAQAGRLLDAGAKKVIIATESLSGLDETAALISVLGAERTLVSLDLTAHVVTWQEPSTGLKDPAEAAARLLSLGCRDAILLEMDRIGTGAGADAELLGRVATAAPGIRFIVGGGIASVAELVRLQHAGASGVLLATTLHDGTITRADLERVKTAAQKASS